MNGFGKGDGHCRIWETQAIAYSLHFLRATGAKFTILWCMNGKQSIVLGGASLVFSWLGISAASSTVIGCGSGTTDVGSEYSSGGTSGTSGTIGTSGTSGTGGSTSGILGGSSGEPTDGGFMACAETKQGAELLPIHLAISLDRSTSMCEVGNVINKYDQCATDNSKWNQSKSALRGFFSKPLKDVAGMTLITWSAPKNNIQCQNVFDTAIFKMKPGDLASLFTFEITTPQPEPGNYTPTSAAIDGAVRHSKNLSKTLDGEKVISILVTDGNPTTCPGNGSEADVPVAMPAAVTAAQNAKAAGVPMYVVGVGSSLSNLNQLSSALGTELFLIDLANPSAVSQKLIDAMDKIRLRSAGCELRIPNAKNGGKVDLTKVNVTRASGGKDTTIGYSEGCKNPAGWQYDVAPSKGMPKKITLCKQACDATQADVQAQLKLVFGCTATQVIN
jgi:hypothetical protein